MKLMKEIEINKDDFISIFKQELIDLRLGNNIGESTFFDLLQIGIMSYNEDNEFIQYAISNIDASFGIGKFKEQIKIYEKEYLKGK